MIDRPQRAALAIGRTGCYFLSILAIAEETASFRPDPLVEYAAAVQAKTLGDDCMVLDAGRLMTNVSGIAWACIKAGPGHPLPLDYQTKPGEREILRYERPADPREGPGAEFAHFVVGDGSGCLAWDPWGDSAAVKNGKLVSKRIFRRT